MSDTPETDEVHRQNWLPSQTLEMAYRAMIRQALKLERERDALKEQLDAALMLGKMQERRHERELKEISEQYRLSSVCRKMQAEIDMLQKLVTAYELEKEKQDGKRP